MAVVNNVKIANFFRSHLTASVTAVATSFDVVDASGLPTLVDSDDYFYLVLHRLNDNAKEIVKVTGVASETLTVVRAQEGTTGLTFSHGDRIEMWFTAGTLDDLLDEIRIEVDKAEYATSAAGVDHGDSSVVNSVAYLVAAAAGSPTHIYLPSGGANGGEYNITSLNLLFVPANVLLHFENGAYLSGYWVLNKCRLLAPANKIFEGNNVAVNANVDEVYPQWWMTDFDDDDNGNDMSGAIDEAESTGRPVRFIRLSASGNPYIVAGNIAVVASALRFDPGAKISVSLGFTMTITGAQIEAGADQIFEGDGTIVGAARATQYLPQWTGATGDGSTDDRDAINRLITEVMDSEGTIYFPKGTYRLADDLAIPAGVTIVMDNGASFSIDAGDELTINGPVSAGAYPIFSGSGTVLGSLKNTIVERLWFLAPVLNDTDSKETPIGNVSAAIGTVAKNLDVAGATVADLFFKQSGVGSTGWESILGVGIVDFADGDTTPSIDGSKTFRTANTASTTITDFDDGYIGKVINILINDDDTTIDFTSPSLSGNRGFSYPAKTGDTITAVRDDANVWHCILTQGAASLAGWDWDSGWTEVNALTEYDLFDTAVDAFSDITPAKNKPAIGTTPASDELGNVLTSISNDDPGYRDIMFMIQEKHDVAPAGVRNDYLVFHAPFISNTTGSGSYINGWWLMKQGSGLRITFPQKIITNLGFSPTFAGADWSGSDLSTALMRIKIRKS